MPRVDNRRCQTGQALGMALCVVFSVPFVWIMPTELDPCPGAFILHLLNGSTARMNRGQRHLTLMGDPVIPTHCVGCVSACVCVRP